MRNVTALVLFCCTKNLIDYSIGSFRKFYPDMKLVIIDNSGTKREPEGPMCTDALKKYCRTDKNTELIVMPRNLGHGIGMHYGLQQIKTTYTYIFESDVGMNKFGLVEVMLELITPRIYSVGPTIIVCYRQGRKSSSKSKERTMRRLWPYSSLMSTKMYFEYPSWDSDQGTNAAPLKKTMQKIADSGKEDKLMIEFDVDKYVTHKGGGTRGIIGIPPLRNYKKWTSHYLKSI